MDGVVCELNRCENKNSAEHKYLTIHTGITSYMSIHWYITVKTFGLLQPFFGHLSCTLQKYLVTVKSHTAKKYRKSKEFICIPACTTLEKLRF